jgi:hypothetical protein
MLSSWVSGMYFILPCSINFYKTLKKIAYDRLKAVLELSTVKHAMILSFTTSKRKSN